MDLIGPQMVNVVRPATRAFTQAGTTLPSAQTSWARAAPQNTKKKTTTALTIIQVLRNVAWRRPVA